MLLDFFNGDLSATEENEILKWKDVCDENRSMFDDMQKEYLCMRWAVRAQLIKGDYSSIGNKIRKYPPRRISGIWYRMMAVAAVSVIAISSVFLSYYYSEQSGKKSVADYGPPARTAILELSDGTHYYMGGEKTQLEEQDGTRLAINDGELVYDNKEERVKKQEQEKLIYNKVIVPRGTGQYRVALSDGSLVWLNSDSRLEYPVNFTDQERRVRISGEAFFEVMRDEKKPFIVETDRQVVSVLGTKFNIVAYPLEPISTTLASGSVKVTLVGGSEEVTLTPGEQAVLGVNGGSLIVRKVSTRDVISWKDGITSIENLDLKQALKVISRSYNVDFDLTNFYNNDIILRGSIPNDESLDVVLSVLSKVVNVKFKMDADGKIRVEE